MKNGINRKDILELNKKYSIEQIENSLIISYCRKKGYLKTENKLIKEILNKNNHEITEEIIEYLNIKNIVLELKNIEKILEILINPNEKKINGAVYTPSFLVNYIIKNTLKKNYNVCDLSCGSGAFLVLATERLAKLNNKKIIETIEKSIYGVDISETSINRTKIILSLLALDYGEDKRTIHFNLEVGDSLFLDYKAKFKGIMASGGFDAIIGNPPFVRAKNIPAEIRKNILSNFTTIFGNFDLFIPFIELGLNLIKKEGVVGYILPNSYATAYNAIKLRAYLQNNQLIKRYVDFNHLQLFEGFTTYISITLFDKMPKEIFEYALIENETGIEKLDEVTFTEITFNKLNEIKWKLLSQKDNANIKKIETCGIPLGKLCQIKTGVATLRNDLYLVDASKTEGIYYLKEYEGKSFKIERNITKGAIHAGTIKTTEEIENNTNRLIYPYVLDGQYVRIMDEKILSAKYPECYKYLRHIKPELDKRDKGKKKYETWYAYGRRQGLKPMFGKNLIFPTIAGKPRFVLTRKEGDLVYAGYILNYSGDIDVLAKILNSRIMWYYVKKTSKPYSSGFMSFAKNFIKNFGIPQLDAEEKKLLKKENNESKITDFLIKKYGLNLNGSKI